MASRATLGRERTVLASRARSSSSTSDPHVALAVEGRSRRSPAGSERINGRHRGHPEPNIRLCASDRRASRCARVALDQQVRAASLASGVSSRKPRPVSGDDAYLNRVRRRRQRASLREPAGRWERQVSCADRYRQSPSRGAIVRTGGLTTRTSARAGGADRYPATPRWPEQGARARRTRGCRSPSTVLPSAPSGLHAQQVDHEHRCE